MRQAVHRTIADVTRDIERWSYNTAVAHCMELLNLLQRYGRGVDHGNASEGNGSRGDGPPPGPHPDVWDEALDSLLSLLAAADAPRDRRAVGAPPSRRSLRCTCSPGRSPTPSLVRQDTVTMVVQVNGKVRDRIDVDAGISEADAEAAALASAKVIEALRARHRSGWCRGRPGW